MKTKEKYSFENWCVDNDRQDLLDRWDYALNKEIPSEITYQSKKKYWFKCPRNIHESELRNIQGFTSGKCHDMKCTKCNSFAQYIIDNFGQEHLDRIWNKDNTLDPWMIPYKSNKKAIFNCLTNEDHIFERSIYVYTNGAECPYCLHRLITKEESLGSIYPDVVKLWSKRNKKTPYEYSPKSGQKVWWKCPDNIHDDFKRNIEDMVYSNLTCPRCVREKIAESQRHDLTGQKFGHLTVKYRDKEKSKLYKKSYWLCECDCGNSELKSVAGTHLLEGLIVSCGSSIHKKGKDNPNWRGGITPERMCARSTVEYENWRNEVYKKDWYTCQCCGQFKGIKKQAHHLINFANNEDLRYDVDNGITLCEDCHYTTVSDSFHNLYGTINNTPEQLEEYINYKRKKLGINIPFSMEAYKNGEILKPNDILKVS